MKRTLKKFMPLFMTTLLIAASATSAFAADTTKSDTDKTSAPATTATGSAITTTTPAITTTTPAITSTTPAITTTTPAVTTTTPAVTTTTPAVEITTPAITTASATPTASKVTVNGKETAFDAYMINGNNYFKLRDVAQVVSGSEKQFEVTWDNDKKAINLVSAKAYTSVGGEMTKGDGTAKTAKTSTSVIYKDGTAVSLTAYTIGGNNYFKLRDLGQTFDFSVAYDAATKAVVIDTTAKYTEN